MYFSHFLHVCFRKKKTKKKRENQEIKNLLLIIALSPNALLIHFCTQNLHAPFFSLDGENHFGEPNTQTPLLAQKTHLSALSLIEKTRPKKKQKENLHPSRLWSSKKKTEKKKNLPQSFLGSISGSLNLTCTCPRSKERWRKEMKTTSNWSVRCWNSFKILTEEALAGVEVFFQLY